MSVIDVRDGRVLEDLPVGELIGVKVEISLRFFCVLISLGIK